MPTPRQKHHLAPMSGSAGGPGRSRSGLRSGRPLRAVLERRPRREAEAPPLWKSLLVLAR